MAFGFSLSLVCQALQALGWSPDSLFSSGEQGVWFDPSDFTTLFQDLAGTTPVTAVEQPVGKMLDKSGRGNHATQATAANRPVVSARVNLLTKTENFSDAVWESTGTVTKTPNYTTAPDGTATAQRIVFGDNNSAHQLFQPVTTSATSYTQGIWAKVPSGTAKIKFGIYDGAIKTTAFDLTTTWQYIQVTISTVAGLGARGCWLYPDGVGYASEILVWHPDLRVANDGVNLPAYQRVNTATDYDTVGFPTYIKFNGTNSSMATGGIDFTATDKLTVFTGVRKLSDAATGMLLEMGTASPYISAPESVANYGTRAGGGVGYNHSTFAAPVTNVISSAFDRSAATSLGADSTRINGVLNTTTAAGVPPTTGNFGNYPLYIGARAGTLYFFNGNLYSLIVRGAQSSAAQITSAETWVNSRTKAF